jgi:hypothetical protein
MNGLAVLAWLFMNPLRQLQAMSPAALQARLLVFAVLFIVVLSAVIYTTLLMK